MLTQANIKLNYTMSTSETTGVYVPGCDTCVELRSDKWGLLFMALLRNPFASELSAERDLTEPTLHVHVKVRQRESERGGGGGGRERERETGLTVTQHNRVCWTCMTSGWHQALLRLLHGVIHKEKIERKNKEMLETGRTERRNRSTGSEVRKRGLGEKT